MNKTVRLQCYWKLDKNIPNTAHHWGILFTSLTRTQGIKITLSLEEGYIILKFDFDFTIKGTKLCSPFLTEKVTCRKRMPMFIQFLSGTGSKIYNWAFSVKSAVKIALEMAGYWPGSFW